MFLNTESWSFEVPDFVRSAYPQADGSVEAMTGIAADTFGNLFISSRLGSKAFDEYGNEIYNFRKFI